MRIATRIVLDMETFAVLEAEYFEYQGPVALAKGGNSKAEMTRANDLQDQQLQLMQQQLSMQQGQLGIVNPVIKQIIANGGMLPQTESAMTATAMNSLPAQYQALLGQINNRLVQRGIIGGSNAGSGAVAGSFGALGAEEAKQQADLLTNIQLAKMQGLQGALNTSLGVSQQYGQNIGTFNTGSTGALNAGVTAANNADQAQTSFMGSLMGALTSPFKVGASLT